MTNLQRRLEWLEAVLSVTDSTGLVPHSPEWVEYWYRRFILGEEGDPVEGGDIVEILRAVIQYSGPLAERPHHDGSER
jgi:hypothetical protein